MFATRSSAKMSGHFSTAALVTRVYRKIVTGVAGVPASEPRLLRKEKGFLMEQKCTVQISIETDVSRISDILRLLGINETKPERIAVVSPSPADPLRTTDMTLPTPEWRKRGAIAVRISEAGEMLGVSSKTFMREIDRGNLHGLKLGRSWRVRVAEIEAYLRRQEAKGR